MKAADFIQRFYQLTPKPKAVFIAFLDGAEDEAIAVQLKLSTPTVRKHIQNLCDHFEITAAGEFGKQNRRQALFNLGQGILQEWLVTKNPEALQASLLTASETGSQPQPSSPADLNGLPQVGQLWGRQAEQAQLKTWFADPDLRLGIITGLPGCGKTSLVAQTIAAAADQFDWINWRSLSPPLSLLQYLDEALTQAKQRPLPLLDSLENQLDPLFTLLRRQRCLLVCDDWQCLFSPQQFAGHYQAPYQDYQTLLERLIQTPHQSLILIISQTLPTGMRRWLRPGLPVQTLTLTGLGQAAPLLLENLGLTGKSAWPQLMATCGDRPLSLLLVNDVIQSLFAGNVDQYLSFNPLGICEDHLTLVQQSLTGLSPIEQKILTVIALAETPISLQDLAPQIPLNQLGLLAALTSLRNRHYLQESDTLLYLEAAIANSVLSLTVKRLWQELVQLQQENIVTRSSYWVEYDFQQAFADPMAHPQFQHLWQSYQSENPDLLSALPSECPVPLSPALGYLSRNWQGLSGSVHPN
ncbi:MAG: hypothetical protein RLZZ568_644 [Cyanobacteriota bacterium]|jgi:hypothetical protein